MMSGAIQIASSEELIHTFERYGERVYTYYGEADQGAENIAARWELFKTLHNIGIERLYEAMKEEYKPLDNYNMTERGTNTDIYTDSMKRTGTVTAENSRENTTEDTRTATTNNTGTVTSADTGTITDNARSNTNNSVYAYDSAVATPHDTTATTSENTRTDNTTNTRTDNTTEQTTHGGTVTDTENGTATTTNDLTDSTEHSGESEHSLTRSGNIGVTSSQQLLESEIDLRVKNSVIYYAVELFVSQNCTW